MEPNELIHETSPYLLQHAHNPVKWFPWGEKALEKARQENKLILVSIGYSACHWCHVMERECFEDLTVAGIMNTNFVCIKVDREERPDIDQVYLEAVQIMTGHGGWPLNCICLPNQEPLYGGTYFPREDWKNILINLATYWEKNAAEAKTYASSLTQELQDKSFRGIQKEINLPNAKEFETAWTPYLDFKDGGFRGAPKFPLPCAWTFLLDLLGTKIREDGEIQNFLFLTLDRMVQGGIYDQLGGGFSRYSTDNHWFAPHFEKMLYDNAQLLSLYAYAYKVSNNPEYAQAIRDTLHFLDRDLRSKQGLYYSALDADSEGVEGKYYVWTQNELKNHLGSLEPLFSLYYHIQPEGNWEGSNILYRRPSQPPVHEKMGYSKQEWDKEMDKCKRTLMTVRYTRVPPGLDNKILCSWNALMIKGICDAYRSLPEPSLLENAISLARYIWENFKSGKKIYRMKKEEHIGIPGFLDDYAFLADAFLHLYQVSFEEEWVIKAEEILEMIEMGFQDPDHALFYYTHIDEKSLIARKKEIQDSVTPSSNSVLAWVYYTMGKLLYNEVFLQKAGEMLEAVCSKMLHYAPSYANWSRLALELERGSLEISILGPEAIEYRKEIEFSPNPHKMLSGIVMNGSESHLPIIKEKSLNNDKKTRIYICRNQVCSAPLFNVQEALSLLASMD